MREQEPFAIVLSLKKGVLKRGIVGTYHKVSKDYLPMYLDEFTFRHNNGRTKICSGRS
jgi:hypothetical protein